MMDDDTTWRYMVREQKRSWDNQCRVALQNMQLDPFYDGLSDFGITLINGVAPRVDTWGSFFPFYCKIPRMNDNRRPKPAS